MDQLLPQNLRDVIDDDLARSYAWPAEIGGNGAFVRANMVSSLDGAATVEGVSAGLSNDDDQRIFGILRDLADVVLVGAGTVREEGYGPEELSLRRRNRRQRWTGRGPLPYAVVTNGGLDRELSLFNDAPYAARPIVITNAAAADSVPADRCELIIAGADRVDLVAAVEALANLGFAHIQCEGGPGLLGSLVSLGLLDELCLSISPLLVGSSSGPSLLGGTHLPEPINWTLAGLHSGTNSLFARYRRAQAPELATP